MRYLRFLVSTLAILGMALLFSSPTAEGAASPSFTVFVTSNEVHGYEWPLGEEVTLLIDDPGVPGPVDYSDAQTVVVPDWDPGQTWVQFVVPETFEIQPGQVITLMHGTTTKIHTVTNLAMTDVDPDTDTVTGTADPADAIHVWVCDDVSCAFRNEVADGSGDWTADFATPGGEPEEQDIFDIGPGTSVDAYERDGDGDATAIQWRVPNPRITASVNHEEVWAADFPDEPEGQTLYYRLDDPGTPEIEFESDMPLIFSTWGTEAGDRSFGRYDVQSGQVFTVRNRPFDQDLGSGLERVLAISHIEVTGVDGNTDIISGYADPAEGGLVCVWSQDAQMCSDEPAFTWNGDGTWIADFAAVASDVKPGHWNSASQYEDDGDETNYWWNLPPWVVVELAEEDTAGTPLWPDAVRAEQWTGPVVTLTINGDAIATWPVTGDGNYTFELPFFDIEPGDVVTLSDSVDSKTVAVEPLYIDQINYADDTPPNTVYGTSNPNRGVRVEASATVGGWWAERWANADAAGDFTADFGHPGNGWREQWVADFGGPEGLGRHMRVEIYDEDNDRVETRTCEGVPRIRVMRSDGRVDAYDFPEGAVVTLTITGSIETWSAVSERNPDNPCDTIATFDLGDFEIPDDATVTASAIDGGVTTTVTHTVIAFTITAVDPNADTVSGTAPVDAQVLVEANGNWRYPTVDDDGSWTADFSTPGEEPGEEQIVDLGPGSSGRAITLDEWGNTTELSWYISNPMFHVRAIVDLVHGDEWPEGALVTLTIDDPNTGPGVDYTDAQTAGPGSWNLSFGFQGVFDVQPGHLVTLTDGVTTKEHTVTNLSVTEVDPDTDTVTGTADPGTDVDVYGRGGLSFASRHEVAGGGGQWTADFSTPGDEPGEEAILDIVPGSKGEALKSDEDGDATIVDWKVPDPQFRVFPIDDRVEGYEWEEGVEVTLTIDDPGTGTGVDYTDSVIAGPAPWDPQQIIAFFHLYGIFDVQPGHLVTLTDGVTTKEHTVTNLAVTGLDPDFDTVSGSADPGRNVDVEICDETGCFYRYEVADGAGDWSADFSIPGLEPGEEATYDLVPGSGGDSAQRDADRDATTIRWRVPDPRFSVTSLDDWVNGNGWPSGAEVTLTIDDPGTGPGVDYTESGTANPWGDFNFYLGGTFDVEPGHEVTLTDGVTTKVHTVTSLAVTDADSDTDTISGTADPGTDVELHICDETGCVYRYEVAEESGDWTADFSTPGDEPGEESTFDLVPGSQGQARRYDDDGDATRIYWRVPNPRFIVALSWNQVSGSDWLEGALATLTIDDPGIPGPVDYTDSQPVTSDPWGTRVYFDLGESFELQPGHVITLTDGVTTKEHTIPNLAVTAVDLDTDTVSGTAEPGADVDVYGWGNPSFAYRHEIADGLGDWTADFSTPGDEPGEDDIVDIVPGTSGQVQHEQDSDGDYTYVNWYVPNPRIYVWPDDDRVDIYDFAPGELATLTIDDPGTPEPVDYTDSQLVTSNPWNTWVSFNLLGVFDIQPGYVVTLSDGVTTKTHTVTNLAVTAVDPETDMVTGTADPGTELWISICGESGCAGRHEMADGFGDWTADFSNPGDEPGEEQTYDIVPGTSINAQQRDADDDMTLLWWVDHDGDGIPNAQDPDDDNDGFTDEVEVFMGTDPLDPCADTTLPDDERGPAFGEPLSPWPPDFNDDGRVNLADVFLFRSHFATIEGDPDYDARFDLNADGRINLADVFILRQYFATQCVP